MATVVQHSPPRRQGRLAVRVTRLVLVALVVVLALLALSLALLVRPTAEGVDTIFGHPIFSVASGSMAPAIHAGDLIVDNPVTPSQAADLPAGQIISFRDSSSGASSPIVTHRIVAVLPGSAGAPVLYRTKGDANSAPDLGTVAPSQVMGVYAARVPFAAYVLSALHQPLTLVVLVMVPVVFLAEEEIRRRRVPLGEQEAEHFTREQPDGSVDLGGHLESDLPLYRAESLRDLPDGELVYLVEGERAADALIGAGVAAVATVTGASVAPTDVLPATPGPAASTAVGRCERPATGAHAPDRRSSDRPRLSSDRPGDLARCAGEGRCRRLHQRLATSRPATRRDGSRGGGPSSGAIDRRRRPP